jgi:hypothetical protein
MTRLAGRCTIAALTLPLLAVLAGALSANGQEPRPADLSRIIKEKLKHTHHLIDRLARDAFTLIADHARELRRLGDESLKRVSTNLTYIKYCAEFSTIGQELEQRAKDADLNGATTSYIRLTINCVECHKFTRDNRILEQSPRPK